MAEPTLSPPIGDAKLQDEVDEIHHPSSNGLANQEEGNVREGDYDAETVERVYRKIDRRIIPGLSPIHTFTNASAHAGSFLGPLLPLLGH